MAKTDIIPGNRVRIIEDKLAASLGPNAENLVGKQGIVDSVDSGDPYPVLVVLDGDDIPLPFETKEVEVIPTNPTAPMTRDILAHLQSVGTISGREANDLYKCRALPRRIRDLKENGWPIASQFKKDATGQRYVRYQLAA